MIYPIARDLFVIEGAPPFPSTVVYVHGTCLCVVDAGGASEQQAAIRALVASYPNADQLFSVCSGAGHGLGADDELVGRGSWTATRRLCAHQQPTAHPGLGEPELGGGGAWTGESAVAVGASCWRGWEFLDGALTVIHLATVGAELVALLLPRSRTLLVPSRHPHDAGSPLAIRQQLLQLLDDAAATVIIDRFGPPSDAMTLRQELARTSTAAV